jgi:hypothetical protein
MYGFKKFVRCTDPKITKKKFCKGDSVKHTKNGLMHVDKKTGKKSRYYKKGDISKVNTIHFMKAPNGKVKYMMLVKFKNGASLYVRNGKGIKKISKRK